MGTHGVAVAGHVAMTEAAGDELIKEKRVPKDVLRAAVVGVVVLDQAGVEVEHKPIGDGAAFVADAAREVFANAAVGVLVVVLDNEPAVMARLFVPGQVAGVEGGELEAAHGGEETVGVLVLAGGDALVDEGDEIEILPLAGEAVELGERFRYPKIHGETVGVRMLGDP